MVLIALRSWLGLRPRRRFGPASARSLASALVALAVAAGCARQADRGAEDAAGALDRRDTAMVHEPCDLERAAQRLDATGDGRPEVFLVEENGAAVCSGVDLDQDGTIDSWVYYGDGGVVRRRELVYARGSGITEVREYVAGELASVVQVSTSTGAADTWSKFEGGRITLTERDTNGDGRVDEWWEYLDASRPNCPRVVSDLDRDGRPDVGSEADYCEIVAKQGRPLVDEEKSAEPKLEGPAALPTERDTGAMPGEEGGAGEGASPEAEGSGP